MPSKDFTGNSKKYEHRVWFNFSFFVFVALSAEAVYLSTRPSSSVPCGSHDATASACQGANGGFACACLGVRVSS